MAEGTSGRRRFSDKWGKHELDVLAVLSSAFPQWLTSRQIAQRVKAYADSYGELADQAAKAAFAKQFQRDRAKLAAMGIAIESRQPEYSSKSEGQDFASYRLQLGEEPRVQLYFEPEDMSVLAAANYLARSMAISTEPKQPQLSHNQSRTQPRVPQPPIPGLGLDSLAPGLGTQSIPDTLVRVVDSRRFSATIDLDGEHLNVAYTDSDDLAMFVLGHPGATIVGPQEAVDAYHRRLHAAAQFTLADGSVDTSKVRVIEEETDQEISEPGDPEFAKANGKKSGSSFQTGSEVDRRLRLMLFLSAHLGEEFSMEELAVRFIGKPKSEDELKKFVAVIRKDISTLTTVSDDGEVAGSQFFDIDWSLLDAEGVVSATNSLGLERLAGISPQYLSMLIASVSYLAQAPLLPADQRAQARSLYKRMRKQVKPGRAMWLSLTAYEMEPRSYSAVQQAIDTHSLIDMEYTDAVGRLRRRIVAPAKIYVDEGVYYAAMWTDVDDVVPKDKQQYLAKNKSIDKVSGKPRTWQVLRLARIERAELVDPVKELSIPDVPVSELRKWSFDNGTECVFITDSKDLPFVKTLAGASVEDCGEGQKVHVTVSSDSWFVAFCIAHARHIVAVGPETVRTMIIARIERELSLGEAQ